MKCTLTFDLDQEKAAAIIAKTITTAAQLLNAKQLAALIQELQYQQQKLRKP